MNHAGFRTDCLATVEDGKVAWTTHEDLAAADAAFLLGEVRIEGSTPILTGDETCNLTDLAAIASEFLGEPVQRQVLTDNVFRTRSRENGMLNHAGFAGGSNS